MKQFLKYIALIMLLFIAASTIYNLLPENSLPAGKVIDKIVVEKSRRKMHVYHGDELLKTYQISLGFNPNGDKSFEGDGKTPEGTYKINNKKPEQRLSLKFGHLLS